MPIEKHINFFEMEKAIDEAPFECPVCHIVNKRAWRYLDNMLFEHVSDRGFRAKHREAGGFCAEHAKSLSTFRDGLAVAIMGQDILEDRIKALSSGKKWQPKGWCPVCEERDKIEHEYLGFLVKNNEESPEEKEFCELFYKSRGLCIPHYTVMAEGVKNHKFGNIRKVPQWLSNFHLNRYKRLLERTRIMIDLSAYGRQEEFRQLSPEDQIVWKELAACLSGNAVRSRGGF
ncbi:MAG: DUF6062 family protein [Spirochaetaceae bacterium]|jgi:hypothetical protein|nr:DUF6062 family protein [Spirochaetaceae bacterium]